MSDNDSTGEAHVADAMLAMLALLPDAKFANSILPSILRQRSPPQAALCTKCDDRVTPARDAGENPSIPQRRFQLPKRLPHPLPLTPSIYPLYTPLSTPKLLPRLVGL
eukprot:1176232-Prorocentrum_minimum.AAC.3